MITTYIYLALIAIVLVFVVWNMFTEKKIMNQLNAVMVIVPLVLRLLLIK
ncbi:MAG: hypothetical protein RSJ41_01425 [Clostridia bacterium]